MQRIAVVLLGAALSGCSSGTTETGYEPRHLGMTDGQRRGLYAPRYSQEQAQAQAEREQDKHNKPSMGIGAPSY